MTSNVLLRRLGPAVAAAGRLRSLADVPGLPQVTPLMRRNDVEAGREAESNAADKRVRESHPGEIDLRVAPQEGAHLGVRSKELPERIAKGRRRRCS